MANGNGRDSIAYVTDCERATRGRQCAPSAVYSLHINRNRPMLIPAACLSNANLTTMINDLCAQHPKLTGARKEQNAAYLKELVIEQDRRAA